MAYIHNGTLLSLTKNEVVSFASACMDLEGIVLSEISQTRKAKYCMMSVIHGILKIQVRDYNKKESILTEIKNKLGATSVRRKDVLYNMGNITNIL